jgi:hypothetical protein
MKPQQDVTLPQVFLELLKAPSSELCWAPLPPGILLLAKSLSLKDTLEVSLEGGQVKVFMQIGHYEKVTATQDLTHAATLTLIKKKIKFSSNIGKFRGEQLQSHI